jgi:ABC-type xylose transport system, permease component
MDKPVVNQSNIRRADPVSLLKKNAMLIILVLVYIFFTVMTSGRMFRPNSFASLINQNAYVYILGCGMLMCMLTGGNIDLSCGAFVCLLGAVGGMMMMVWNWSTGVSLLAMLAIGIAVVAIFGLSRHGISTANETDNDRRCNQFAATIFETLRDYNHQFIEYAEAYSQTNNTTPVLSWLERWNDVLESDLLIPFPAMADIETPELLVFNATDGGQYIKFTPAYDPEDIDLNAWTPLYYLSIEMRNNGKDLEEAAKEDDIDYLDTLDVSLLVCPNRTSYPNKIRYYYTSLIYPGGRR